MSLDLKHFKDVLEKEKGEVENHLNRLAKKPDKSNDWQPKMPEANLAIGEQGEAADIIEEMENNLGIEKELEKYLGEIKEALFRIEKGSYGVCEKTGEPISEERLQANPVSRTCRDHI